MSISQSNSPDNVTYHVSTNGSDTADCGATSRPCRTLQHAVNMAASGDTLKVARGSYAYNPAADTCDFLVTRAVMCYVDKHLSVLGGFVETNWNSPNPIANRTVIDGQGQRRGVMVLAYNATASLRMEGFTIQNGLALGANAGDDYTIAGFGGGMYAQNCPITLRDMVFRNNRSAGGDTGSGYGGAGSGGGLAITFNSPGGPESWLERVSFEGNTAQGGSGPRRGGVSIGGGVFVYQANLSALNLRLTNNVARAGSTPGDGNRENGLASDALGGGIGIQRGSVVALNQVVAESNSAIGGNASTTGGGAFGGGIHSEQATLTLADATLRANSTRGGDARNGGLAFSGGLDIFDSDATVQRARIFANVATSGNTTGGGLTDSSAGAGIYITDYAGDRSIRLENVVLADNVAQVGRGQPAGGGGGGMTIQGGRVVADHLTVARNVLGNGLVVGAGIVVQGSYGGDRGNAAQLDLNYSIVSDHTTLPHVSTVHVSQGSAINLNRGLFANNTKNTNEDGQPLPPGVFNGMGTMLNAGSVAYASPGAPNHNYHLTATSPALDQATGSSTALDLDAMPRPFGAARDIGADEFGTPKSFIYVPILSK